MPACLLQGRTAVRQQVFELCWPGSCLIQALRVPQAGQSGQGTTPGLACREWNPLPCESATQLCCECLGVPLEKSRWVSASVYSLGNVGQL